MKEQYKAFEEITTRNVTAITQYTKTTREMVQNLMKQVEELKGMIAAKSTEVSQLRQQVSNLQAKIYKGGT